MNSIRVINGLDFHTNLSTRSIYYLYGFWLQIYKWLDKKIGSWICLCQPQNGQNSEAVNLLYSLQHYFLYLGYIPPTFSSYRALQYLLFCRILSGDSTGTLPQQHKVPLTPFSMPNFVNHISSIITAPQFHTHKIKL